MVVGDLVYNDDFDCIFDYKIHDGAEIIFNTRVDRFKKPLDSILDMKIKCITIEENLIIIEATKN